MSRYDVYATSSRGSVSYVLDVQADVLSILATRVVIPLASPKDAPKPARGFNPRFQIDGRSFLMLTQFIATVPARELRTPVLSLDDRSADIVRALDLLLAGY